MCLCIPVSVDLCVYVCVALMSFEAVPFPQSRSLQAPPPLAAPRPRKGGRPHVHLELRAAVVYQDTSVAGS